MQKKLNMNNQIQQFSVQPSKFISYSAITIAVLLLLTGCNPTFNPIKKNDKYYSIFGYLNASADTQYVRIEKLRDSLFTDTPTHLDAKVELTNLSTGQSATMHDSVFHLSIGKVHNYYTTLPINPHQKYKLEVSNRTNTTSAKIKIPGTFPAPTLVNGTGYQLILEIRDIDRLVAVKAVYYTYRNCTRPSCPDQPSIVRSSFQHLADTVHTRNGTIEARIDKSGDLQKIEEQYYSTVAYTVSKINVVIAAGNADWPNFLELDNETVAHPGTASNVEGGTGLLGGIVSDTVHVYSQ